MNKVTSYLKNVGKSISYASLDVGKSLIPEVSEFTQTNEELFKSIYATVSHSKQSIKYAKKLAKESQLYKDINTGINNVFSDIKTGNFYNKERADQGIESATDSMLGLDELDDFNFDDWDDDDDGSLDDFQDNVPSVDKGDIVIADTVSKSSNLSAQLISKTVASTSNNIIKANMASTNMAMAHNVELVAGIRTSIAGVHESINSLLKFAQETVPAQSNIQSQYFTDSMSIMKENNAILKEMLEMQRNLYNRQREEYKSIDQFSNIFSGGFDLTEYFKAVKNNIKNLDSTGMAGMLGNTMGGSSMLSQMLSNPLGAVVTGLIQSYLPKNVVKDIANFSKTLGGFFPTLIGKLNKWKDDDFGFRGILGRIFGLKVETKKSIDTSKYNKGAVPFDGITRKSIIEVIPGYLSKIESILSGSSQRLYDYETGKWLTAKDIKKKKDDEYAYAVKDSFSEISDDIKTFIKTLEKEKSLKAETKKSLEEDVYKMMEKAFEEGFFSPEDVKENSYKYGFSNSDLMESLAEALSKLPVYKLSSTVGNMAENKRRYGTRQAELESSGHAMSTHLYNDSKLDSHLKFHGKYKDEVIGNTAASNLLNIKDDSGMNVLNYLNQILANLSYIRDYGSLGAGKGKNKKGNKIQSFDDYKKQFDKPYILENIQKLDKEAKNRDEYYEKYNYDKSVDMDDAVIAAIYNVHKKADSDDDDDYKKYGKRYKETNKWQKEMASIPGDTFLEKWHQATSIKEKQILIMGSLSDIAKKPATLLSGMIASAEKSIYNFLFKAETDELDSSTGEKIKGFFPAVLNKMRSKWDELTTSIDEKLITPLVQKYGLDEKWNQIKEKLANSKPGEFIRNAKNNISSALRKDIGSGISYVKNSVIDVAEPFIYNKTFKGIHEKKINKNKETINDNQETLKARLGGLSKEDLEQLKTQLAQENPELLEQIKNLGFSKGGTLKVVKDGLLPPYAVSKGETIKITPNEEKEQKKNQEDEINNIIKLLYNYNKSNKNLQAKIVSTEDKLKAHENDDTLISNFVEGTAKELDNIKNKTTETIDKGIKAVVGIKGDTPEEQEKNIKKEKNKILSKVSDVFSEMKGEGARTASKAILGGGIGLLSGVIGGPLIGAGIGASYSIIKSSDTIKDVLFGEEIGEGDEKTREGGFISKKVQDAFKKYVPDMGKYGVAGGVASFLLPFGPLVGAAVGAGIGLTKNSETMQKMLFGEEGLINEERKEKIKKYLPKAAIGAAAGMFLGPFGLLGNAAIGAGTGMLTGSEEFRDLIFGEKDANGDRIGGIKGALEEHFIEPIKNFGKNFKDDFFRFIKTSMIDPLNEAITPIANEIAFQTKRVVFGIPKWFLNLGKDYIAVPLLRKLEDSLISPLFDKIIKPMFSGITGTIKGLISLPFRAVGKVGEQTRKHQIRQGRDVVGTAKDRLKFADDKKMGSYKYESFDSKLAEKAGAGDTSWLEELTARTGMLAHGSDYFNKEIKNARKELSKVVSDYYKSGLFNHDKESHKRIKKYINNNDIELAIQELTEITDSRSSGGPLGSNEAADAIAKFNKANKKYQVARDNRDKFGNINKEKNAIWMEQQFGSDWKNLNTKRLFDYARKESAVAGGKKVSKSDLFKDPTQLITKGEEQITAVLKDIRKILAGDKYTFQDEEKDAEYDKRAEAGKNEAMDIISKRKSSLKNNLSDNNIKVSNNTIDLLYGNKEIYDLVLSANSQGITYDDETIKKLCELDLKSKDIKLLKKFPYAALMPGDKLKKDLNHNRNDYATISKNSIYGARHFRNINLGIDNLAGKINQNLDESTLVKGSEVDKEDSKDYMYQNTNYGLRRYRKDQKGKWTVDLSDSDTKVSLQKENEDESRKSSFFNSFNGIKDGVLGLFNRDKEKDKEEKKEPWYKKLFNVDLGEFGAKLKFGAAIAGGFTLLGAISKLWENRSEGGVVDSIGTAVGNTVNPVLTKIGNWFFNEGDYAAPDKGLSGFLDKHIFPNLFAGMNVFFGTVLPSVVTAFIKNIPALIRGALKGVSELFGWTNNDHNHDADVQLSGIKTSSGKSIKMQGSGNSWLSKLLSDSTTTANNINSITADENGNVSNSTYNTQLQTDTGNSTTSSSSGSSISNVFGSNNSNNNSDNSNASNETVSYEGIGILYKKDKNGKLTPITEKELASGKVTEFYNESGEGHWIYNPDSQTFEAADTETSNKFPGIVAYAAIKSTLTGRTPGMVRGVSKLFNAADKALSKTPIVKNAYNLFATPVKAIGKSFGAITKTGAYTNKSFNRAMNAAKTAAENPRTKTLNTLYGDINKKTKDPRGKTLNALYGVKKKSKDTAGDVVEGAVKNANKTYESGLLGRAIKFIRSRLSKILNNFAVIKKISEALAESGAKESATKVVKKLIDKFMDIIAKKLVKRTPKILFKILSMATGILTAVYVAGDFLAGVDKAESILGISEPTVLQELIAGLVNIISNEVFFGFVTSATLVTWSVEWIFPIFNIDASEFKEERAKEEEETKKYNLEHGTNLSTEDRLYQQKSIKGKAVTWFKNTKGKAKKAGNWIADRASSAAEWIGESQVGKSVRNAGSWIGDRTTEVAHNIREGVSGIASGIRETAATGFDFASYAITVVRDTFADAITGKNVETEGLKINKKDPNYETKQMIYYITKIVLKPASAIVSSISSIVRDYVIPLNRGIAKTGIGIGTNIKNIFTESWKGSFTKAMSESGVDTGNDVSNVISNGVTNTLKPILAPFALVTRGVGFIADHIGDIISGLTKIGSGIGNNIKNIFTESWNGNVGKALTAPGIDTGNTATNMISNVVTNTLKPFIAPFTLVTRGVGFIVKHIDPVIEGFRTIGSSIISSISSRFTSAWKGDLSGVFRNDNPNTGNRLVDVTARIINGVMTVGTTIPALSTAAIGAGVRAVENILDGIRNIRNQSSTDDKILEKANTGDIRIWSSEYWKLNGSTEGISGKLYAFNSYLNKVLNLPTALLGMINPANWDIRGGIKAFAKWLGIKDEYDEDYEYDDETGSGTSRRTRRRKLRGKGTMGDNSEFVSQVDPKYKNKRFNTGKDTEVQTLGDSGCAPATAANVINLYAGTGTEFDRASKAALKYKEKDSGVTPEYFESYLGNNGISTYPTSNKNKILEGIGAGKPTILLGNDPSDSGKTPYGSASSHYVLATGTDGKGNVIIQDPESKSPNTLYPINDVLDKSQLGMITGRGSIFDELPKAVTGYYDEKLLDLLGLNPTKEAEVDTSTTSTTDTSSSNSSYNISGGKLQWPVPSSKTITSPFGYRNHPISGGRKFHNGIDIGARSGKDIIAAEAGTVSKSAWNGGYGNCVMINHGNGLVTLYGHCSVLKVKKGQKVKRAQVIAKVGSTGMSTGPHLHFEVQLNGKPVNPLNYVSKSGKGTDKKNRKVVSIYSGRGLMEDASKNALKYKDTNSGVVPEYFENYLGTKNISTHSTTDKNEMVSSIKAGTPTILLGTDHSNSGKTPYGPSSAHYVLATGADKKGNVIIQDPESSQPNTLYPMDDVIENSQLGMITSQSSGRGRSKVGRKVSQIKNKVNSKLLAGRGKSTSEIEKRVWSRLRGAGFSEVQVAGVMGNIKHESGFNPSIVERGSGIGFGLCQWSYGRRTQIEKYAKSVGKSANNVDVQIDFLIAEMTPGGGCKGYANYQFGTSSTRYDGKAYTGKMFRSTKDVAVATKCFCFCWERPSYSSSVNHIDARIKSAKAYYKKYTGTAATTSSTDDNTSVESANTPSLFAAAKIAALSYYDEKLLGLLGLNDSSDTSETTNSEDSTSSADLSDIKATGDAATVLKVAMAEVGTRETPDGSNKQKYGKEYGLNGQPWCGIFVWWVFKHAGCLSLIKSCPNIAYVPTIYSHFKQKGQIVGRTKGRPGDIFISGGKAHTGIIKENLGGGKYKTVEGNCGNAVKSITRTDITYVVRVKYANAGKGSGQKKIANYYKTVSTKNRSYNNIAAISSGRGTNKYKSVTGSNHYNKYLKSESYQTNRSIINTNTSMHNYDTLRKSISGRGTSSGYSLPALNSSSTKSGYYSTASSMPTYNNMSTGSSINIGNSSTEKLLSVIIDVLSIIANNSEKLSQIVELLSKALDLNLTENDISKLSSNSAQVKNKIANALKSQGSTTGMGSSIMTANTESLATAMYSIASA